MILNAIQSQLQSCTRELAFLGNEELEAFGLAPFQHEDFKLPQSSEKAPGMHCLSHSCTSAYCTPLLMSTTTGRLRNLDVIPLLVNAILAVTCWNNPQHAEALKHSTAQIHLSNPCHVPLASILAIFNTLDAIIRAKPINYFLAEVVNPLMPLIEHLDKLDAEIQVFSRVNNC